MKETQILSVFHDSADPVPEPARAEVPGWVFDACHVGVVLRAVLLVQAVLALAAMFVATTPLDWLGRLSVFTAGALPGTLLWLLVTCGLKRWTGRWSERVQQTWAVCLGALAGLYGCGVLLLMGLLEPAPWVASAFAGAALAATLVLTLAVRATHVAPAAAAARLAELQARIRPHFLFNTLNSAIALVRAEPLKAEQLLEDLSELFRHALSAHGESVTLGEEIALAQRYLAIEQVRFGERIRVEWALDPLANHARLPPLLLQPHEASVEPSSEWAWPPQPQPPPPQPQPSMAGASSLIDKMVVWNERGTPAKGWLASTVIWSP